MSIWRFLFKCMSSCLSKFPVLPQKKCGGEKPTSVMSKTLIKNPTDTNAQQITKSQKGTNIHIVTPTATNLQPETSEKTKAVRRNRENSSDVEQFLGTANLQQAKDRSSISTDDDFKRLPTAGKSERQKKLLPKVLSVIKSQQRANKFDADDDDDDDEFRRDNNGEGEATPTPQNRKVRRDNRRRRFNRLKKKIEPDKTHQGVLPNLKYGQMSFPDLNNPEEVALIEKNVEENQRLHLLSGVRAEDDMCSLESVSSESVLDVADPDSDEDHQRNFYHI